MFEEVEYRLISSFKGEIYGVFLIIFEFLWNLENKESIKDYN